MSVRDKYELGAIESEIVAFEKLSDSGSFDEAVDYFREHLEKPTLFGLEPSLLRARLLQRIDVEALSNEDDKCFVLYALALTLNLTGGYPNRAIPLYEKHDKIAEKTGNYESLSLSLGHHAKALRQVGRFAESEKTALRGLEIIREREDYLREAVNLYWLGMGLAHRGEPDLSVIALERSLRIFKAKFEKQSEGVVNAFLAQRALWLGSYKEALDCATRAEKIAQALESDVDHADLHGAVKILSAAMRMKGEALVFLGEREKGEALLFAALEHAGEIEFVEEELPALRALAMSAQKASEFDKARQYLGSTWKLAERGQFALYNADSFNVLARIELVERDPDSAMKAARKAYQLSWCDGGAYSYKRGIEDATLILSETNSEIPKPETGHESKPEPLTSLDIDPNDQFHE